MVCGDHKDRVFPSPNFFETVYYLAYKGVSRLELKQVDLSTQFCIMEARPLGEVQFSKV